MLSNRPSGTASPDGELWRLGKSLRIAVCRRFRHPLGLELRLDVNGETLGTRVEHTLQAARAQSAFLRATMIASGWTSNAE
jgi:hypothetical protein